MPHYGTIRFADESKFVTLKPTMKTFQNKTVLITGGTSGIGKATALAFAKEGAHLVISGSRAAEGEEFGNAVQWAYTCAKPPSTNNSVPVM